MLSNKVITSLQVSLLVEGRLAADRVTLKQVSVVVPHHHAD